MFERYTEQARRAIFFAHSEAVHRRAPIISTAHLFLGIASEEDSRSAVAGSLKEHIVTICALLQLPHRPCSDVPYLHHIDLHLDQDAKRTLACAAIESDPDGRKIIDTDHLLRGLLCFSNEASRALNSVSIHLADIRAASIRFHGEPQSWEVERTVSKKVKPARKSSLPKLALIGIVGSFIALVFIGYILCFR